MESWRGRGRRAGRDALDGLTATWKAGSDPGPPAGGRAGPGNGSAGGNGDLGSRMARDDGGDGTVTTGDVAGPEQDRPAVPEQDRPAVPEQDRPVVPEQDRPAVPEQRRAGRPELARVSMPDRRETRAEQSRVPGWLQTGAAWSWRLLLLAAVLYLIARAVSVLSIVVVPCTAALLLTALLQPLTNRLRRAGLPSLAATWCTLLIAALVLGGLVMLVTNRVSADYPTLVEETRRTTTQVES